MEQLTLLFEEFLMKAITMTENFLAKDFSGDINFEEFTSNRERLLQVIDQISRQINWDEVDNEKKIDLNRQIEFNKKLDENEGDDPGLINSDPYGEGWIVKIKISDESEIDHLMNAEQYSEAIS